MLFTIVPPSADTDTDDDEDIFAVEALWCGGDVDEIVVVVNFGPFVLGEFVVDDEAAFAFAFVDPAAVIVIPAAALTASSCCVTEEKSKSRDMSIRGSSSGNGASVAACKGGGVVAVAALLKVDPGDVGIVVGVPRVGVGVLL